MDIYLWIVNKVELLYLLKSFEKTSYRILYLDQILI